MSYQNQAAHGNMVEQGNPQCNPQYNPQYNQQYNPQYNPKYNPQYNSPQAPPPDGARFAADDQQKRSAPIGRNGLWHYSLCACCKDMNSCCEAWWCTPCQQSRQCNMFSDGKSEIHWPYCLLLSCVDPLCTSGLLSTVFACQTRRTARERYGIAGSDCGDCCTAWCCGVCSTQQVLLEMTVMNDFPGATCYSLPQNPAETRMS